MSAVSAVSKVRPLSHMHHMGRVRRHRATGDVFVHLASNASSVSEALLLFTLDAKTGAVRMDCGWIFAPSCMCMLVYAGFDALNRVLSALDLEVWSSSGTKVLDREWVFGPVGERSVKMLPFSADTVVLAPAQSREEAEVRADLLMRKSCTWGAFMWVPSDDLVKDGADLDAKVLTCGCLDKGVFTIDFKRRVLVSKLDPAAAKKEAATQTHDAQAAFILLRDALREMCDLSLIAVFVDPRNSSEVFKWAISSSSEGSGDGRKEGLKDGRKDGRKDYVAGVPIPLGGGSASARLWRLAHTAYGGIPVTAVTL